MRHILTLLSAALLAGSAQAQDTTSAAPAAAPNPKPIAVKWNPGGLAFGKVALHGEYNLRHRRSVTFGAGIPVTNTYAFTVNGDKTELASKTFSLQAGYRLYLGKKTMSGVYFEPYLKYLNYKGTGLYTYNGGFVPEVYQADLDHSAAGLGAQLGAQFFIAKVIVVDLFLLGPEANVGNSEAVLRQVSGSPVGWDSDEVKEFLRDLPLVGGGLEISVDNSSRTVTARRKGFVPGFRAGLSVGIRF